MFPSPSFIIATFNSGNPSLIGESEGLTPPTNSFGDSNTSGSPFNVSVLGLITSSRLLSVISPVFGFTVYVVVIFITEPSFLLTISTLSLAGTLIIVSVGFTMIGSCGCASISPVFGFTV